MAEANPQSMRQDENMVNQKTEVLSLGEAFYAYNHHQTTTYDIKDFGQ